MAKQRDDRGLFITRLPQTHERMENADTLKGEDINEWIAPFAETDAGKRPDEPTWNFFLPEELDFSEYSKILEKYFHMTWKDGIVEAKAYTPGYPGWIWGGSPHAFLHKLFSWVSEDRDAECFIFGSEGDNFFHSIGAPDAYRNTDHPMEMVNEFDMDQAWVNYEHQFYDGTADIECEVGMNQPTISVWQGGAFHSDLFLLCDITVATKDAWMVENHFRINMYPGDGVQIPWRMFMGQKRFSYAELVGEVVTARKALEYGMINEIVVDVDAAWKRAWEIAELIMHQGTRQTRRLTVQCLRKPLKEAVANELKFGFAVEMWNTITEQSPHHPIYWQTARAEARETLAAEAEGKILRPRLGEFRKDTPVYPGLLG